MLDRLLIMIIKNKKTFIISFAVIVFVFLCGCGLTPEQNLSADSNETAQNKLEEPEELKKPEKPEETPFIRPSPRILDLEGEYELVGMSRDGMDESEAVSQFALLGMENSLSVREGNLGSFMFMNRESQVDFHVLDGMMTITDSNGDTKEIEYRAHDGIVEFEWQGDLLQFEKTEGTENC